MRTISTVLARTICTDKMGVNVLFRRVRASLSQKWMVPSDPIDDVLHPISNVPIEDWRAQTASGEGPMDGVEGDVIDGVYQCLIFVIRRRVFTVALEREVVSAFKSQSCLCLNAEYAHEESFSSMYLGTNEIVERDGVKGGLLDSNSSFDTANSETTVLRGGEARDHARLPFQRRDNGLTHPVLV